MMWDSSNKLPRLPNGKIDYAKLHKKEEEIDVDIYFTKKELDEMSSYDKKRYKNVKMNYEVMLMMGLPALKPDFMKGPAYRARMATKQQKAILEPSDSDEGSDEEWVPNKKSKTKKVYKPPTASKKKKPVVQQPLKENSGFRRKMKKSNGEKDVIKYSLRERPSTNYMDLEVPDDDNYLYCEECNKEFDGECPVHGELLWIKDSETSVIDPDKAVHSLPPHFEIRDSGIHGAGLGVWAMQEFPARVVFGPYGGEIVYNQEIAHSSGYAWQIYKNGKPSHFVDAKDKAKSNWMRYVNCAASETEQNLVAFQYRGEIYYRSYKNIPAGTELFVWYGQEYARELGMIRDKNLLLVPQYINGEEIFICLYCKVAFSAALFYVGHLLQRHASDKLDKSDVQLLDTWRRQQGVLPRRSFLRKSEVNPLKNNTNGSHMMRASKELIPGETEGNIFQGRTQQSTATGEISTSCGTCGGAILRSDDLHQDVRKHTEEKSCKCDRCSKPFAVRGNVQEQQGKPTIAKHYKCEICGMAFDFRQRLQRHQRLHTGEKPYKCDTCGKAFTHNHHLLGHKRIHTGDKPYKCDTCGKAFTHNHNLLRHQTIHTGDKPYKCDTCGKAFTQNPHLLSHQRIHTGEKPYKCDTCGKAFKDVSNLQTHQRIHSREKPYKCDTCGKVFSHSSDLKSHQRIHTGEKPYKSDTCGMAFSHYPNLWSHQRIHTGEKPYKCDTCGNAFTCSHSLVRHQRIHTGEKP